MHAPAQRVNALLSRRTFVAGSVVSAAGSRWGIGVATAAQKQTSDGELGSPEIVDTNVHLFRWPFRRLKYDRTDQLVQKLRRHRITQAWAGSFDAVLHKQLDLVNASLTEECKKHGDGMLLPIGSVNPAWPDWQEDLRRCHEQYLMKGIRLYPGYHGYKLDHSALAELIAAATKRGMIVQIAIRMEDERVHQASLLAPAVNSAPLLELLPRVPDARVQLLNADTALRGGHVQSMIDSTGVVFDIAGLEAQGALGSLIDGTHSGYAIKLPVERLLFGSHAPFFPCESSILKLFESPLNREELQLVMHANARRLIERRG
jgi:hypothetical protein